MSHPLDAMPRVDRALAREELAALVASLGRDAAVDAIRGAIARARAELLRGERERPPSEREIALDAASRLLAFAGGRARRVINATGVIVHTNLGRAPLGQSAASRVEETMRGSCSIELDLETGRRGGRGVFAESALRQLSGAESALVVNNCAAAILLLLAATARGRAVVVSRGELVEIGGGFRVPEIMSESGARLVEVGTTNKTRVSDYERALDAHSDVGAILRVHQGNFRQIGFVERPHTRALAALASQRGVPLLEDLGGGALVDLGLAGLPGEPTVRSSIEAGVSALTFSTDKALGGPQGGVVLGRSDLVERARRHPLARAFRLGRLPLSALEGTLERYLTGDAWSTVPVLAMARASLESLDARTARWKKELESSGILAHFIETRAEMGGGTLAGREVASRGLALEGDAEVLSAKLRAQHPAVLGRIVDGRLVVDARSVPPADDELLVRAIVRALTDGSTSSAPFATTGSAE